MKIYISGKWSECESIRDKMDDLEECNHEITYDWTDINHEDRDHRERQIFSVRKSNAIRYADILVAIIEDSQYKYAEVFAEIGVAIGCDDMPIWIVSPVGKTSDPNFHASKNPFYHHVNVEHFNEWEDLLKALPRY